MYLDLLREELEQEQEQAEDRGDSGGSPGTKTRTVDMAGDLSNSPFTVQRV